MPVAVSGSAAPSQAEQLIKVTSAIALELIKAYDTGQTVSLNEIRNKASKKFNFSGVPRLVDIISAIPDEYKKVLLPKLRARPIRTASGVSGVLASLSKKPDLLTDCRRRRHVQTSPVSSHCHDRQHLRILSWRARLGFRLQHPKLHRL